MNQDVQTALKTWLAARMAAQGVTVDVLKPGDTAPADGDGYINCTVPQMPTPDGIKSLRNAEAQILVRTPSLGDQDMARHTEISNAIEAAFEPANEATLVTQIAADTSFTMLGWAFVDEAVSGEDGDFWTFDYPVRVGLQKA